VLKMNALDPWHEAKKEPAHGVKQEQTLPVTIASSEIADYQTGNAETLNRNA
jgi:hypothetical protein